MMLWVAVDEEEEAIAKGKESQKEREYEKGKMMKWRTMKDEHTTFEEKEEKNELGECLTLM